MAEVLKHRPFNLLYKFEPQRTVIDRIYDFVIVEGRIIVVSVMFLIILAFIYRFPLDKSLNDEKNKANETLLQVKFFASNEKVFRDTLKRTDSAKQFIQIYDQENPAHTQIIFSGVFSKINEIKNTFGDDIIITSYSYNSNPESQADLILNGYASKFNRAEDFREKLRQEKTLVDEVLINNLGANKDGLPEFNLKVTLKNKNG